jgi:hypothetical protein
LILRKIISVFLLLVLFAQVLPLKQTMRWLLSGQVTEEVPVADDGRPDDLTKYFLATDTVLPDHGLLLHAKADRHVFSVELPGRHADDIPTPPPNC